MNTILAQALQLTVLGMGMTFASIGALALGMLVMTRATRDRNVVGTRGGLPPLGQIGAETRAVEMVQRPEAGEQADAGSLAAVAAVAVALASQVPEANRAAQAAAAAVAVALAGSGSVTPQIQAPVVGAWDSYVRSLHVSRRAGYDGRRVRG